MFGYPTYSTTQLGLSGDRASIDAAIAATQCIIWEYEVGTRASAFDTSVNTSSWAYVNGAAYSDKFVTAFGAILNNIKAYCNNSGTTSETVLLNKLLSKYGNNMFVWQSNTGSYQEICHLFTARNIAIPQTRSRNRCDQKT